MSASKARSSMTADSVNFINKYNTGRTLLGLFKQISDPRSSDTYKHLYKIRTAYRKKRDARLSGDCLCKQSFSCSGRAYKKNSLGDLSSKFLKFLRVDDAGDAGDARILI